MSPRCPLLPALLALALPVHAARFPALLARDVEYRPCSESRPTVTVTVPLSPSTFIKTVTVSPSAPSPYTRVVTVTVPGSSVTVRPPEIQTVTVTPPNHGPLGWKPPAREFVTVTVTQSAPTVGTIKTIYVSDSTTIAPLTVTLIKTLTPSHSSAPHANKVSQPPSPVTVTVNQTAIVPPTTVYTWDSGNRFPHPHIRPDAHSHPHPQPHHQQQLQSDGWPSPSPVDQNEATITPLNSFTRTVTPLRLQTSISSSALTSTRTIRSTHTSRTTIITTKSQPMTPTPANTTTESKKAPEADMDEPWSQTWPWTCHEQSTTRVTYYNTITETIMPSMSSMSSMSTNRPSSSSTQRRTPSSRPSSSSVSSSSSSQVQ